MPDGDVVHSHLRRAYQQPYKILCEGVASPEECARKILIPLRDDLQRNGQWPLRLSLSISDLLSQKIGPLELANDVEAARISREIDELIRQADCCPREKELIARASKSMLSELRYGRENDSRNCQLLIFEQYIRDKYEAEFKERIPLNNDHHHGVCHGELMRRLEALEPCLALGIHQFAQDAIKNQNLNNLRLPRRVQRDVDLEEDLLAG
jgi:hypothetical protein